MLSFPPLTTSSTEVKYRKAETAFLLKFLVKFFWKEFLLLTCFSLLSFEKTQSNPKTALLSHPTHPMGEPSPRITMMSCYFFVFCFRVLLFISCPILYFVTVVIMPYIISHSVIVVYNILFIRNIYGIQSFKKNNCGTFFPLFFLDNYSQEIILDFTWLSIFSSI